MVTRRKDAVGLQRKVAAQSGKRGQKGTRRIYRKKGVLVKGLKADAQKKAIRRNIVLNHRRGKKPQLVGGSTGLPVSKSRIRRAMRPDDTMALYYSSSKKYNPLRPLATVRSGRCFDADRKMRVGKKGSLTCRIKPKAPKRPKRAKRAAPKGGYSAAQKRSQESVKYVTQQNKSRKLELTPTQVMRIAGAVTQRRKAGMSKEAALAEVLRGGSRGGAAARPRAAPKAAKAVSVNADQNKKRVFRELKDSRYSLAEKNRIAARIRAQRMRGMPFETAIAQYF